MSILQVEESPINMIAGETIYFTFNCRGSGDVDTPVFTCYYKGTDITTTAMPDGGSSGSASGTVLSAPYFTASANYIGTVLVNIQFNRGSNTFMAECEIRVKRKSR